MVEELAAKPQPNEGDAPEAVSSVDMEMETSSPKIPGGSEPLFAENGVEKPAEEGGGGVAKRKREEGNDAAAEEEEEDDKGGASKKRMVERSLEEERLEKMEDKEGGDDSKEEGEEEEGGREEKESMTVSLGPKVFDSSKEMFDYFFKLLHNWSPNLDINEVILQKIRFYNIFSSAKVTIFFINSM